MNDREQLRKRLAQMVFEDHICGFATADEAACDILAEIEAAGYVLIERGKAERLIALARVFGDNRVIGPSGDAGSVEALLLQPGDLDSLEGGE